jgi:hypothetical protein
MLLDARDPGGKRACFTIPIREGVDLECTQRVLAYLQPAATPTPPSARQPREPGSTAQAGTAGSSNSSNSSSRQEAASPSSQLDLEGLGPEDGLTQAPAARQVRTHDRRCSAPAARTLPPAAWCCRGAWAFGLPAHPSSMWGCCCARYTPSARLGACAARRLAPGNRRRRTLSS